MKSFKLIALAAALAAAHAHAFDWPAAGGTATIPAGTTVTVTGNDVTTAAACGAIVIEAGATLKFSNITANATFAGSISGSGTFSAENASDKTYRLTFTGDLSAFTGNFDFKYVYSTFNTALSGSAPIKIVAANIASTYPYFTGGHTYNNPLDVSVGANYGLQVTSNSVIAGAVTCRGGRLHGGASGSNVGGRFTGVFKASSTIYPVGGISFEGGILPNGSAGTGSLYADNGTMHIKSQVGAISQVRPINANGKVIFWGENLLADSVTVAMGQTYGSTHRSGTYDLNGYSQRAKTLSLIDEANMIPETTIITSANPATLTLVNQAATVNYKGQLKGAASLDFSSSSSKTLTLNGTANNTTGSLTVRTGTLALGASAKFLNLSSFVVTNTGTLSDSTENVNPNVELNIFGSGVVNVAAGTTLQVFHAKLDGDYIPSGDYVQGSTVFGNHLAGGGTLRVLNDAPVVAGDTYVWTGAAGDGLLTTDGNWEGGSAPDLTAGTAKLFFSAGTASATVSGMAHVYGITFCTNAAFTLTGADANAKVVVGEGGFLFTNTAAASVTHVLNVPVEMGTLPQTWRVASTNTLLSLKAPLTGRQAFTPLTIDCRGRVYFWADNSDLLTPLVLTNVTTVTQPYIYNMKGLGAKSRFTTVWGGQPRFITDAPQGGSLTNETPLRLHSNLTNQEGAYINSANKAHLYLTGPVVFNGSGFSQSEIYFKGNVHFVGGITNETNHGLCFRMAGGNNWIEGKPMRLTKTFQQDYPSVLNIAVTNNYWELLYPMKATIRCHCDYALAVGRPVYFGAVNSVFYSTPMAAIDLNGYNQSVSRIYPSWTGYETVGGHNWASTYGLVTSATPATLEITGTETTIFPVKFEGAAGLHMNGTGSFTITNKLSNTTGELKVSKGTVRFARDAGWTAVTNIVLAGGTLAVGEGAGAKAFGSAQDMSDALLTVVSTNAPTLSIAENERPTVNMLMVVEENGKEVWKNPGVYGGPEASLSEYNTLNWISGAGTLRVRRSISGGTMLIIR